MSANDPLMKRRNITRMAPKPGSSLYPGSSMEGTCLLAMRCPAYRRHDSYPGFRTELENLVGDGKGKGTSGRTTRLKVPMRQPGSHCSIVARKRSNVRGAKGAGHPRQAGVNGKPEELLFLAEAGRLPRGGTSRMTREGHVRICGRLGVKFPGPTRQRHKWGTHEAESTDAPTRGALLRKSNETG
jgi:hypothetical protein